MVVVVVLILAALGASYFVGPAFIKWIDGLPGGSAPDAGKADEPPAAASANPSPVEPPEAASAAPPPVWFSGPAQSGVAPIVIRPVVKAPATYSVSELLRRITALQVGKAEWPEIFATLNPDNHPEAQRALESLRGPHMFVPDVGLNVIEEECRRMIAVAPGSDWLTALLAATKTMDRLR
jgi:hypothetical protein